MLILDEPTAGLDPNQIREVRKTIRELGQTKTILLSTHILQEVEAMCNRVLFHQRRPAGVRRHAERIDPRRAGLGCPFDELSEFHSARPPLLSRTDYLPGFDKATEQD